MPPWPKRVDGRQGVPALAGYGWVIVLQCAHCIAITGMQQPKQVSGSVSFAAPCYPCKEAGTGNSCWLCGTIHHISQCCAMRSTICPIIRFPEARTESGASVGAGRCTMLDTGHKYARHTASPGAMQGCCTTAFQQVKRHDIDVSSIAPTCAKNVWQERNRHVQPSPDHTQVTHTAWLLLLTLWVCLYIFLTAAATAASFVAECPACAAQRLLTVLGTHCWVCEGGPIRVVALK